MLRICLERFTRLTFFSEHIFACRRFAKYSKLCIGEKVTHTSLYNLRIIFKIFQPQIGTKIRMLQPVPGKHHSYEK